MHLATVASPSCRGVYRLSNLTIACSLPGCSTAVVPSDEEEDHVVPVDSGRTIDIRFDCVRIPVGEELDDIIAIHHRISIVGVKSK